MSRKTFCIQNRKIDPQAQTVYLNGKAKKIEPKVFGVLIYLINSRGRVVSKKELFDTIWKDTIVVEKALTRTIYELRKLFNDDPKNPKVIETIPKTGYRLIADVRVIENRPIKYLKYLVGLGSTILLFILTHYVLSETNKNIRAFSATPITSYGGSEYGLSKSSNDENMAFVWNGGIESENWDIYIKKTTGDSLVQITNDDLVDGCPIWHSSKNELLYFKQLDQEYFDIHYFEYATKKDTILYSGFGKYPTLSWSTDGEKVFFNQIDTLTNSYSIYCLDTKQFAVEKVTNAPKGIYGDSYATISPDQDKLAFVRLISEGVSDVFLKDLNKNTPEEKLTEVFQNIYGLTWNGDGSCLYFSKNNFGIREIWQLNLKSRELAKLSINLPGSNPYINNNKLYFEYWESEINLWEYTLNSTDTTVFTPKRVVSSTKWDIHPDFSRDGSAIVFSSNRTGEYQIWLYDKPTNQFSQITDFDDGFIAYPKFHPNQTKILFSNIQNGVSNLYIADKNTDSIYNISNNESHELLGTWSNTGDRIFYTTNKNGGWEIWEKDLLTNNDRKITTGFYGEISNNGRDFYFTKVSQSGLWKIDLLTLELKKILRFPIAGDWGNWTITQNGISYLERTNNKLVSYLNVYDFNTKKPVRLKSINQNIPIYDPSLSLTPDGRSVIIGKMEGVKCDIYSIDITD